MKTNTNATDASFDRFLLWTSIAGLTLGLALLSVAAPLAYLWTMGVLACAGVLAGTLVISGALTNEGGIFGPYFAIEVAATGFRLVGVILMALAGVSAPSSD